MTSLLANHTVDYETNEQVALFIHPKSDEYSDELMVALHPFYNELPASVQQMIGENDLEALCQQVYCTKSIGSLEDDRVSHLVASVLDWIYPIVDVEFQAEETDQESQVAKLIFMPALEVSPDQAMQVERIQPILKQLDEGCVGAEKLLVKFPLLKDQSHNDAMYQALRHVLEENVFEHIKAVTFAVSSTSALVRESEKLVETIKGCELIVHDAARYHFGSVVDAWGEARHEAFEGCQEVILMENNKYRLPGSEGLQENATLFEKMLVKQSTLLSQVLGVEKAYGGAALQDVLQTVAFVDVPRLMNASQVIDLSEVSLFQQRDPRTLLSPLVGNRLAHVLTQQPASEPYAPTDRVSLLINPRVRPKVLKLIEQLKPHADLCLVAVRTILENRDVDGMCQYIYQSKIPKSFAEEAYVSDGLIFEQGFSWSVDVYEILEELYTVASLNTFHTGAFGDPRRGLTFVNTPKPVHLMGVPGICFAGMATASTQSYQRVVVDGELDMPAYVHEMKARLLPIFQHVQHSTPKGQKALLKVPGLSCGFFGGVFANGQVQRGLDQAIKEILAENVFSQIEGVVLDVFKANTLLSGEALQAGCQVEDFGTTRYISYESQTYNQDKAIEKQIQINSHASVYDDKFSGCMEFCVVAADPLALLGNDMYFFGYVTNDGTWAGTADIIQNILSCGGYFDVRSILLPVYDQKKDIYCFLAPKVLPSLNLELSSEVVPK